MGDAERAPKGEPRDRAPPPGILGASGSLGKWERKAGLEKFCLVSCLYVYRRGFFVTTLAFEHLRLYTEAYLADSHIHVHTINVHLRWMGPLTQGINYEFITV